MLEGKGICLPGPAKSFIVTKVLVALVRTPAFEFPKAILRKSIKLRKDSPAMPNSTNTCSIQTKESARNLGAFSFCNGSYAKQHMRFPTLRVVIN